MSQPFITVHKFGGAPLADLNAFRHAAEIIGCARGRGGGGCKQSARRTGWHRQPFRVTTTRYKTNRLVITGLGAGITAAGVFTDVLTLAEQR